MTSCSIDIDALAYLFVDFFLLCTMSNVRRLYYLKVHLITLFPLSTLARLFIAPEPQYTCIGTRPVALQSTSAVLLTLLLVSWTIVMPCITVTLFHHMSLSQKHPEQSRTFRQHICLGCMQACTPCTLVSVVFFGGMLKACNRSVTVQVSGPVLGTARLFSVQLKLRYMGL